jgi:hypothetical protein
MKTKDLEEQNATEESLLSYLCNCSEPASVVVLTQALVQTGKKRAYGQSYLYGVVLAQTSAKTPGMIST